ncbi:MAG TPA: serine hydrolase domain-containing protein [Spirochaetota bacterium]
MIDSGSLLPLKKNVSLAQSGSTCRIKSSGRNFRRAVISVSVLTAIVASGISCRSLSSRVMYDPAASITRIQNGSKIETEVSELANPLVDSGNSYGISVGVITPDGSTQTFGYGRTGIANDNAAPRGDTIFEIGSLSKLFASALLAILVNDGTLRYEDRVRDILPASIPLSSDAGDITLYDLDTHTAGFPRELFTFQQMCYFTRFLVNGNNLYGYIDKDWLYDYLSTCTLTPKAERHYVYSNLGIGLLAHLIEVKTGRKYADLLKEKIFDPLKMKDTGFILNDEQRKRLAVGHAGDQPIFLPRNTPLATWDMGEIMSATGGIYSTVDDLALFAKSHLGLIKAPITKSLEQTHFALFRTREEDVIEDSACGWVVDYFDNNKCRITYKHGMVAGYSAYIGMNTETRIAVIVLYNTFNWDEKVGHNLVLRLSEGLKSQHTSKR